MICRKAQDVDFSVFMSAKVRTKDLLEIGADEARIDVFYDYHFIVLRSGPVLEVKGLALRWVQW